jgi:hypothetical protein
MKKIFLAVLFSSLTISVFAQWQPTNAAGTDNTTIYHMNGNVGIATTTPQTQLQVNDGWQKIAIGGIPGPSRSILGWSASYIGFNIHGSGTDWITNTTGNSDGGSIIFADNYGNLKFANIKAITGGGGQSITASDLGGRVKMILNNTGNVGIGGNPSLARTPLEVSIWGDNNSVSTALTLSQMNSASPNNKAGVSLDFGITNNSVNDAIHGRISVKETYWSARPKMTFNLANGSNVMTEYMVITYDGNVGIGQSNPANKLDVNGIAHAKEVRIDVTGWEDSVFDKDYSLLPLTDVEKFIEKHHHLPEIPGEPDMIENGLEVGAMNRLLVKKIEELTLYVIQQQKKITELEQLVKK